MEVKTKIAIIYPVFNPEPDWEKEIIDSSQKIKCKFTDKELQFILVNDGSTSPTVLDPFDEAIFLKVNHTHNLGKGAAIRSGIKSTEADVFIYTDYDIPFGYNPIIEMIEKFEKESIDVIISKRDHSYFRLLPLARKIVSKGLILINFFIFRGMITDTQGGLKGYNRRASEIVLQGNQNGFFFETESLMKLSQGNFRISTLKVYPKEGLVLKNLNIKSLLINFWEFTRAVLNIQRS